MECILGGYQCCLTDKENSSETFQHDSDISYDGSVCELNGKGARAREITAAARRLSANLVSGDFCLS